MKYPTIKAITAVEERQLQMPGGRWAGVIRVQDVLVILQDMEIDFLNLWEIEKSKQLIFTEEDEYNQFERDIEAMSESKAEVYRVRQEAPGEPAEGNHERSFLE